MADAPRRLRPPKRLIHDPYDPAGKKRTCYLYSKDQSMYEARVDDPKVRDWIVDASQMGEVVRADIADAMLEALKLVRSGVVVDVDGQTNIELFGYDENGLSAGRHLDALIAKAEGNDADC